MRQLLLIIAATAAATTDASCQTQAPADASAYCQSGSGAGISGPDKTFVETIKQKCRRGDIIIIPAIQTSVAARVCDFSRAVAQVGGNVVCVLTGSERSTR